MLIQIDIIPLLRMVKAVFNGTNTTIYVGAHYQITNGVVTKHYQGGAFRVGGTLYYGLGDHLGSTGITTNAGGSKIAEMRYTAWGEVRFASGSTPSNRSYTGQRSYTGDFGLMFYNARWYDPSIGRFAQADTFIPGAGNSQAWDRYAYANNNPIRYTDSSGHWVESALDVAFIIYDVGDIAINGLNWENGLSLAADIAGLALPLVTGGGLAVRAVIHADDAAKAVNAVDNALDVANAIDTAIDATNAVDNVVDAGNSADNLLAAAQRLAEVGPESDEAADLIRILTDGATKNPNANVVSLGSNGLYQKPGFTYFELSEDVWNALGPEGQKAINSQFMFDQMNAAKPFVFDFFDPTRIGRGSRLEMGILSDAVNAGIYQLTGSLHYNPIIPMR